MTTVDVLGSGDELTDEASGSVDAAMWIVIDPYRRSATGRGAAWSSLRHVQRRAGGAAHIWRLFRTRAEAGAFMRERYGNDLEVQAWAEKLGSEDFADLIGRHATREPPGAP